MPSDRPRLALTLDEDTKDRWKQFAKVHHVDMSAIGEALGRLYLDPEAKRLPTWLRDLLGEAYHVQAERGDRAPRED